MISTKKLTSMTALLVAALCVAPLTGCKAKMEFKTGEDVKKQPPPPPPADGDGDGIPDASDKCPAQAEDGKAPEAKDGCPNLDEDKDGIETPADKCPDKAETKNDFEDADGCPDEKPLVEVTQTEVKINQKIMFDKGKATITPESMPVVKAVAKVLVDHPEIGLVLVGGHASQEGDAAVNLKLTQSRVDAVTKELVAAGVSKDRLVSQGYGFHCPVDLGKDEASLEKNRRVEFKIVQRDGKNLEGVALSCEGWSRAGKKPPQIPAPKPYKPADAKKEEPKK